MKRTYAIVTCVGCLVFGFVAGVQWSMRPSSAARSREQIVRKALNVMSAVKDFDIAKIDVLFTKDTMPDAWTHMEWTSTVRVVARLGQPVPTNVVFVLDENAGELREVFDGNAYAWAMKQPNYMTQLFADATPRETLHTHYERLR